MDTCPRSDAELRLRSLERRVRRAQALAAAACVAPVASGMASFAWRQADEVEHLRVRRLELVDHAGVVRRSLGEDGEDAQRRSRAAGLHVYDATGAERGRRETLSTGS